MSVKTNLSAISMLLEVDQEFEYVLDDQDLIIYIIIQYIYMEYIVCLPRGLACSSVLVHCPVCVQFHRRLLRIAWVVLTAQ